MARASHLSRQILLLVLLLLTVFTTAEADGGGHIRSLDDSVPMLMARGVAASRTFRALVGTLEQSDLIVHVSWQRHGGASAHGQMQFVTSVDRCRYVRITLTGIMSIDNAVALLGHELQHAREIADAPWVVDTSTYHALYRAIGYPSCGRGGTCFDTRLAWDSGMQVMSELREKRRRPLVAE